MVSCSKDATEEMLGGESNGEAENSVLQVTTRGTGEATISYPVQVYVFQGDECKAVQTIGDAGQTLNIALVEGTYSVYAVGGTSATDYTLPTKDEATTTTAITLKEGSTNGDLMAASATATLVDGGTNTVTLGLERKVMLIQDITISQVPTAATAVSVTIAPLWESLTVGGTYSGTNGSSTITLTKQSDNRTWTNAQPLPSLQGEGSGVGSVFLLPPSSSPASVSVNITIGGTTKTYTYSTSDELEAGYKKNISGTYTEAVGVNLTGTITGATWLGERTISFDFDENGSSASQDNNGSGDNKDNNDNTDNNNTGNIPAVGTIYQTCFVLSVTDNGDNADVTLLSPNEVTMGSNYATVTLGISGADAKAAAVAAAVDEKIAEADVDAISDWRLPTATELNAINAASDDINAAFDTGVNPAGNYLYTTATGAIYYRALSSESEGNEGFGTNARVRPVVTVTINKEP